MKITTKIIPTINTVLFVFFRDFLVLGILLLIVIFYFILSKSFYRFFTLIIFLPHMVYIF